MKKHTAASQNLLPHNLEAYKAVTEAFGYGNRAAVVHATGTGKSYIIEAVSHDYRRVAIIAPNNYVLEELRKRDIQADFLTYPTVYAMVLFPENQYDLIVLDEFHRAGAECWGIGISALLASNPDAKILGTTATEIRYLDNARNMADELFMGNVVSRLPLTDAWLRGILPVPKYVVGLYNYEDTYRNFVERLRRNGRLSQADIREASDTLKKGRLQWETSHGVAGILKRHLPADVKRMIVFCDKTDSLPKIQTEFSTWMARAGYRSACYTVHYRNPDSWSEMEDFQNDQNDETGVKVLFAIDMLNEGIHVPDVDAIVMFRQTSSKIILLQQMGRCMNVGSDRTPVIFDFVDNLTSTSEVDRLRDELTRKKAQAAAVNDTGRTIKDFTIIDEIKSFRDLIYSVNAFRPNRQYEENLALLSDLVLTQGRWPLSTAEDNNERAVAAWAYHHREDDEISKLRTYAEENLGVRPWTIKTPFDERLRQLSAFIKENRRWPASGAQDEVEKTLYIWLRHNLVRYPNPLLQDYRESIVREYGCDVSFKEGFEKIDIETLVNELESFLETNRRWPSPSSDDEEERRLYNRSSARYKTTEIAKIREKAEQEYGITFRRTRHSPEENFKLLESYVKENGTWPTVRKSDAGQKALATFAYSYREDPRLKEIADRYGLKVEYQKAHRKPFEESFNELTAFVREKHRWPVAGKNNSNPDKDEVRLHNFASRYADRNEVRTLLEEAQKEYGFVYNPRYETKTVLEQAERFIRENGRWPKPSSRDREEYLLGNRLKRIREKEPETFKEFEDRMRPVGGERNKRIVSAFDTNYEQLLAFIEANHAWPKQDSKDSDENRLACYFAKHYTDKVIALRDHVEKEYGDTRRRFYGERIAELETFVNTRRRFPSKLSVDRSENSLAAWVGRHGRMEEIIRLRDKAAELKKQDTADEFEQKLNELRSYIRAKGKWPSHHSDDETEYAWGYFISKNRKNPRMIALRDSFRKESAILVTASYETRMRELEEFVRKNNRLPVWNSTDPFEKGLYHLYVSKKNRPRYAQDFQKIIALIKK